MFRYREGDCRPKSVLCDPNYPIEIGDLLFREPSNNLARPASALINQGSENYNQLAFHNNFLGVALQKNGTNTGETLPLFPVSARTPANVIEVATQGVFEYPVATAMTYQGGEYIGPANNAAGNGLLSQCVKTAISGISGSIGRAVPAAAQINATVLEFADQVNAGANNAAVPAIPQQGFANFVAVEILSTVFYGGEITPVTTSSSSGTSGV